MVFHNLVLTKDLVLSNINQEFIFSKYLNINVSLKNSYRNPLRKDNNPGCRFFIDKGVLKFIDYSIGKVYDCISIVMEINRVGFQEALNLLYFNEELKSPSFKANIDIKESSKTTLINVKRRNWTELDLEYWKDYFIDKKPLDKYAVYPAEYVWLNSEIMYSHKPKDRAFIYHFGEYDYKIYFPYRNKKRIRFIHNNSKILQGYKQLPKTGKIVIITKSLKDVMVLHKYKIPAVAPMSESTLITQDQYDDLSKRFDIIISLMDRDIAGVKMSKKLKKKYNIPALLFEKDGPKDISDAVKLEGEEKIINRIENAKRIIENKFFSIS